MAPIIFEFNTFSPLFHLYSYFVAPCNRLKVEWHHQNKSYLLQILKKSNCDLFVILSIFLLFKEGGANK